MNAAAWFLAGFIPGAVVGHALHRTWQQTSDLIDAACADSIGTEEEWRNNVRLVDSTYRTATKAQLDAERIARHGNTCRGCRGEGYVDGDEDGRSVICVGCYGSGDA